MGYLVVLSRAVQQKSFVRAFVFDTSIEEKFGGNVVLK